MANITSVGIGSGVLTSDLIDKLAEAERAPTELRLDRKEEEVNAELSAFGRLRSAITDLRLPARTLSNPSSMAELSFNSTNAAISGSLSSSAKSGTYSIEVTDLAKAHSIATGEFADKDTTTLGTGTLTIQVGTDSVDIDIDGTNNTLQGIADAINAESGIEATASVIDNGSGYRLVINSNNTGVDNAIEITVDDDDTFDTDATGLSQLAFNTTQKNLQETVVAEDASIEFNGITVTRATNTVDDLIQGVTLNLNSTNVGSPSTVTIAEDKEKVADRVEEFVEKFNELKTIIAELTAYNPDNPEESGILLGDSTVRTISSQTRSILSGVIPGLENAGARTLVDVGIETNKDTGLLVFDRTAFIDALENNTDDVVALFAEQGRTSDGQIEFVSKSLSTAPGEYDINITQLATHGDFAGTVDVSGGVTIDADNDNFTIEVDGIASGNITLTAGVYTSTDLVTEIQAQIDADSNLTAAGVQVVVGLDGSNQLTFTSNSYGSASTVEFTAVDTNTLAQMGIDAIAGTDGLDVAGTINGVTAVGSGQQLSLTAEDDAKGIVLNVTGGATGSRGTVTFIEGVADKFVDLFTNIISIDGTLTARTDGLNAQLLQISEERLKLDERVTSLTERLVRQFTAADILVNRLNSTMEFIGKQLAALEGTSSSKK